MVAPISSRLPSLEERKKSLSVTMNMTIAQPSGPGIFTRVRDGSIESCSLCVYRVCSALSLPTSTTDSKHREQTALQRQISKPEAYRGLSTRFRNPLYHVADFLIDGVKEAELSACVCVLYQIYSGGKEPFERESEDDVIDEDDAATSQACFSAGGVIAALATLSYRSWSSFVGAQGFSSLPHRLPRLQRSSLRILPQRPAP